MLCTGFRDQLHVFYLCLFFVSFVVIRRLLLCSGFSPETELDTAGTFGHPSCCLSGQLTVPGIPVAGNILGAMGHELVLQETLRTVQSLLYNVFYLLIKPSPSPRQLAFGEIVGRTLLMS